MALGPASAAAEILRRLNGQIYLIRGNHERVAEHRLCRGRFSWVGDYEMLKVGDQKIALSHYAHRVWNCMHHGAWHAYAHSHGNLEDLPNSKSTDVGVDCWDFTPVSYDQFADKMATKTFVPVDHHSLEDAE